MTELEKAVEAYIENPANYLEYQDGWEDLSDLEYVEKAFKFGANWQYEQFEKNRLAACDNMTKEEFDREQKFTTDFIEKNNRVPTYSDAIEYGRKQMIDKACEYIHNHWDKLLVYEYNQFGGSVFNRKKTVEQFRKAMED